jgi:hypothetical protein
MTEFNVFMEYNYYIVTKGMVRRELYLLSWVTELHINFECNSIHFLGHFDRR